MNSSLITLIISNIITIILATVYGCDIISVLWIYWLQNIIIGIIAVFDILKLKQFSTEGCKPSLPENKHSAKMQVVGLFIFVWGFFHFVYAIFLTAFFTLFIKIKIIEWKYILIGSAAFLLHHIIHYINFSKKENSDAVPNIGIMMFKPFYRILPMHLIIILSIWIFLLGNSSSGKTVNLIILILFLSLKTITDVFTQKFLKTRY